MYFVHFFDFWKLKFWLLVTVGKNILNGMWIPEWKEQESLLRNNFYHVGFSLLLIALPVMVCSQMTFEATSLLPEFALAFLTGFCSSTDRLWLSRGLFQLTISSQLLEGKGEWIISYIQQSKLELLMNACGSCNKHWRRETYGEADGGFQWKFKEGKMQDIASSLLRTMSFGVPRPTSTRTLGELSNLLSEQHCCVSV